MKCIGHGIYENKCENNAGSTHSDHWCQRCDEIRRKTITKQLEQIQKDLKEKEISIFLHGEGWGHQSSFKKKTQLSRRS